MLEFCSNLRFELCFISCFIASSFQSINGPSPKRPILAVSFASQVANAFGVLHKLWAWNKLIAARNARNVPLFNRRNGRRGVLPSTGCLHRLKSTAHLGESWTWRNINDALVLDVFFIELLCSGHIIDQSEFSLSDFSEWLLRVTSPRRSRR